MTRAQMKVVALIVGIGGILYGVWKLMIDGYYPSELVPTIVILCIGLAGMYAWQKMTNADKRQSNRDEDI